jgi:uncharacterized protein (TIRG00374 family)
MPEKKFKLDWRYLAGAAVSIFFLYIAVRELNFPDLWEALIHAKYLWVIPGVLSYLAAFGFRTLRWMLLIQHGKKVKYKDLVPTMAVGRAANNILPWRLGEGVRVFLLRSRNGVPMSFGFGTLIVERTSDGIVMLIYILIAMAIGGLPDNVVIRDLYTYGVIIFSLGLILIYVMLLFPKLARWLIDTAGRIIIPKRFREWYGNVTANFVQGLAALKDPWTATLILVTALMVWNCELGIYRLIMNCFDFGVDLHQLLLFSAAANLGTSLPSGAANIGTFDTPGFLVLTQLSGINPNIAASYMLILHGLLWLTETGLGIIFLPKMGMSWKELGEKSQKAAESEDTSHGSDEKSTRTPKTPPA